VLTGPDTLAPLAFQWFDYWLMGKGDAVLPDSKIRYFHMGKVSGRRPIPGRPPTAWCATTSTAGAKPNSRNGDGVLSQADFTLAMKLAVGQRPATRNSSFGRRNSALETRPSPHASYRRRNRHSTRGQVLGDPSLALTGFAPADKAKPGDLTFAENETYLQRAEQSAASAILVDGDFRPGAKTLIRVANARIASHQDH
jgi:hypothetical protein